MKPKTGRLTAAIVLCVCAILLIGCTGEKKPETVRNTITAARVPECAQEEVYSGNTVSLDASRTEEGYLMIRYEGSAEKVKVQIRIPEGTVYTYNLSKKEYETLPLTGGSGLYQVDVLENAYEDLYATVFSRQLSVEIADEFAPFLYPNQYVWYTSESKAMDLGIQLSQKSSGDLDYVQQVYRYVIRNITYDQQLAETVKSGYLPDVDRTLETKKGICFDYASLMAALLRSQGIPTKLVIGYSGQQYHAWIDVYLEEMGWVDKVIYFDGSSWSLMDPTLAANNVSSEVKKYVGDGENYLAKYQY